MYFINYASPAFIYINIWYNILPPKLLYYYYYIKNDLNIHNLNIRSTNVIKIDIFAKYNKYNIIDSINVLR